jgi:hypothetical protein
LIINKRTGKPGGWATPWYMKITVIDYQAIETKLDEWQQNQSKKIWWNQEY